MYGEQDILDGSNEKSFARAEVPSLMEITQDMFVFFKFTSRKNVGESIENYIDHLNVAVRSSRHSVGLGAACL